MRGLPAVVCLFALAAGLCARAQDLGLRPQLNDGEAAGAFVQLGAERSPAEAARSWAAAVRRAQGGLDGLSPRIFPVSAPGRGALYRLRVGPMDASLAQSICARLKARGIACIVAPSHD
jgi:hypothetical protein